MKFSLQQAAYHAACPENFSVCRPDGPEAYAFVHFLRPMALWLDGKMQTIEKGAFILFAHGMRQQYYPLTPDMLEHWCHFYCEGFEEWIQNLGLPFGKPFYIRDSTAADAIFQTVTADFYDGCDSAVSLGMQALFYSLAAACKTVSNRGEHAALYELRSTLRNRLDEPWNVASIAAIAGYSPAHLNRLYRRVFGISPMQDLFRMRVERAKYLLSATSYSVEHIAQLLHYNSSTSFISRFHAVAGITPLQYRKQWSHSPSPTTKE
ncbi:MAG: helix-turn-helix transcriptional regulator [Candidatus Merdivicinus sp.]|jgi:AraC-like DNA-binding protein